MESAHTRLCPDGLALGQLATCPIRWARSLRIRLGGLHTGKVSQNVVRSLNVLHEERLAAARQKILYLIRQQPSVGPESTQSDQPFACNRQNPVQCLAAAPSTPHAPRTFPRPAYCLQLIECSYWRRGKEVLKLFKRTGRPRDSQQPCQ